MVRSVALGLLFGMIAFALAAARPAQAQQDRFIQIEAIPTLATAQTRARAYSNAFPNVNGFRMQSGWYAIALGPYTPEAADEALAALRAERLIPGDSYLAVVDAYRQQFWPAGSDTLSDARASRVAPDAGENAPAATPAAPPTAAAAPEPPREETRAEALASERALSLDERKALQEALQWEGYYTAAIDGAFGRGTRGAMQDWQRDNGFDDTGVLTTAQRRTLMDRFRAVFADLGLAPVSDAAAGIEIVLPLGKVRYARTEAPFVQYDATDDDGMRVLLISQTGDEATLFGLYDIMQTLEIVPPEGERRRRARDFLLTGQSPTLNSHTYARLVGGAVKGYTLVWRPGGDPRIMDHVLKTMEQTFRPVPGVILPDTAMSGDGTEQSVDLLAGLEIRQPDRTRTGFFVDASGAVLTTAEAVAQCATLTIGAGIEAQLIATEDALGLALLRPRTATAPLGVATFQPRLPRLQSEVVVAGYSYGAVLELPVLTFGALADIRGLGGETDLQRLDLEALPGDAGGPVLDQTGAVVGLLRPRDGAEDRRLPPDVNFAVGAAAIERFLTAAGVSPRTALRGTALAPEDISRRAADMTVQVSCWN